jgi:hypothetical protein
MKYLKKIKGNLEANGFAKRGFFPKPNIRFGIICGLCVGVFVWTRLKPAAEPFPKISHLTLPSIQHVTHPVTQKDLERMQKVESFLDSLKNEDTTAYQRFMHEQPQMLDNLKSLQSIYQTQDK